MEIKRFKNKTSNIYDYNLIKDNKQLSIFFGGNLDLYLSVSDGEEIPYEQEKEITFDITKENYDLYTIFKEMYDEIVSGNIYDSELDKHKSLSLLAAQKDLVDNKKNICWISDDAPRESADRLIISKEIDKIKLTFKRTNIDIDMSDGFKSPFWLSVRIRNSGSRYDPFNVPFMRMYQNIQTIDPEYHQVDVEEIIYQKKNTQK